VNLETVAAVTTANFDRLFSTPSPGGRGQG